MNGPKCHCVNTFCAQFFIKQGFSLKLIFLLPSIVIESASLRVGILLLVDIETEHSQTWLSSRFHPLCSNFCIRTDTIIGHSFSTQHGNLANIEKWIIFGLLVNIPWSHLFGIKNSRIVALRQLYLCLHCRFNPVIKSKEMILLKFHLL